MFGATSITEGEVGPITPSNSLLAVPRQSSVLVVLLVLGVRVSVSFHLMFSVHIIFSSV